MNAGCPPAHPRRRMLAEQDLPTRPEPCDDCNGRGGWREVGELVMCHHCHGTGDEPCEDHGEAA